MEPRHVACCLAAVVTFHVLTGAAAIRDPVRKGPTRPPPPRPQTVLVAHTPAPAVPELKPSETAQRYRLRIESDPVRPAAGTQTWVSVWITDAQGQPVTTLQVHHERLAHFLVVSANLEEFHHVHAEDFGLFTEDAKRQGRFTFPVTFAQGGDYSVAVDFMDQGKAVHRTLRLTVGGPPQRPTAWRLGRSRKANGLEVRLLASPDDPEAGSGVEGTIVVSADGTPVGDLEPYLGAPAHLAIFGEGASTSAHIHAAAGGAGHDHQRPAPATTRQAVGPKLTFGYTFPQSGRYRIFVQFSRRGTVSTVPFDVEVSPTAIR